MPAALENQILDALLARANLIVGAPTYNTNPAVKQIGIPRKALPVVAGEAIYLVCSRRMALRNEGSASSHVFKSFFQAWCVADTERAAWNVSDDMMRAVRTAGGEDALFVLAKHGFYEGDCVPPDPETLALIGKPVLVQEFSGQYELLHT